MTLNKQSYRAETRQAESSVAFRCSGDYRSRQDETTIRALKENYRSLCSAMSQGVVLHELVYSQSEAAVDYVILDVNPAYELIIGLRRSEMMGNLASDLYGMCPPPHLETYAKVVASGNPTAFETYVPALAKYFGVSVFTPEPGRFVTIFNDITAYKQAHETLSQALDQAITASQAKSTFLANMSHEIRTPLNAILGYAQILQRKSTVPMAIVDAMKTIEESGNQLLGLINDILDLSKIEAGRMELLEADFDFRGMIKGLSSMLQLRCKQKGLTWRVEWKQEECGQVGEYAGEEKGGTTPPCFHSPTQSDLLVRGDEGKLRQTLINLLSNAVKFTEEGEIFLRISVAHVRNEEVCFTFEVIDTGVGIPAEDYAAILEPFSQSTAEQRREEGVGLGLAIANKHIELMGGKLAFDSERGKGSRFFFSIRLKLASGEATARATTVTSDQNGRISGLTDGCEAKALIVDDKKENRDVLSHILSDIGISTETASNGQEALAKVRMMQPDIVFMDIWLPQMDGIETARKILSESERNSEVTPPRLVAVSASALNHERQRYFSAGFDDFLAKPVRIVEVYSCLAKLLRIEYKYSDDDLSPINPEKIALPEELVLRMRKAAELYLVTELEEMLDEVCQICPGRERLAKQLRGFSRNFDMKAVLGLLEGLELGAETDRFSGNTSVDC